MKRPAAVRRKLLREKWLLSKGKYQGRGESTARSFSHITFVQNKQTSWTLCQKQKEIQKKEQLLVTCSHLKTCLLESFKAFSCQPDVRKAITNLDFCLCQWNFVTLKRYNNHGTTTPLPPPKEKEKQFLFMRQAYLTFIFRCSWLLGSKESVIHHSYAAKNCPGFSTLYISL